MHQNQIPVFRRIILIALSAMTTLLLTASVTGAEPDCNCDQLARIGQGDLNLDGIVNQQDLTELIENYGSAPEGADGLALGDLDLDGQVQMTDIGRLLGFWGRVDLHEHRMPIPVIRVTPDPDDQTRPLIAPAVVHVHGVDSTLGRRDLLPQRATFAWHFGDQPGRQVVADPLGKDGDVIDLNGEQEGFNAAYLYEEPGTYEITLTLTNELGETVRTSVEVEVLADEGPKAREVRYVDSELGIDRMGNGYGTSPEKPWRTFGFALRRMDDNMRLRFRRGQTFPVFELDERTIERENFIVEAYGEGDRPVIYWKDDPITEHILRLGADADTGIVRDLEFKTDFVNTPFYDPDRVAHCDDCSLVEAVNLNQAFNVAVINCAASNTEKMIDADAGNQYVLLMGNDSQITRQYQYTIRGHDFVVIGCRAEGTSVNDLMRVGLGGAERINVSFCDFDMSNSRGSAEVIRYGTVSYGVIHHSKLTGAASKVGHNNELTQFFVMSDCELTPRMTEFGEYHLLKLAFHARDLMFTGNTFNVTSDTAVFINSRSSHTDEDEQDIIGVDIMGNTFNITEHADGRYSRVILLKDIREDAGNYDVRNLRILGNDFSQAPLHEFEPDVLLSVPSTVVQICGNTLPPQMHDRYPYVELRKGDAIVASYDFEDMQRDARMVGNEIADDSTPSGDEGAGDGDGDDSEGDGDDPVEEPGGIFGGGEDDDDDGEPEGGDA